MSDREAAARSDAQRLALCEPDEAPGGFDRSAVEPDGFRSFLADLALRLVGVPSDSADRAIGDAMPSLTRLLGADRCGIAQFSSDGASLLATQGFARPGLPPWRSFDLAAQLPWYTGEVRKGHTHVWQRLPHELPPAAAAESDLIMGFGIRSHVMVPLRAGNEILGCLGVSRRDATAWTPRLLTSLEHLAAVLADAIRRHSRTERFQAAEEVTRAILASAPVALLVLDRQGFVTHLSHAWTSTSRCTEFPDIPRPGIDYLAALDGLSRERPCVASELREGLQSVLDGRRGRFETIHHCSLSVRDCHFHLGVTRQGVKGGALIVRTDLDEIERAKADLERSRIEVRELKARLEAETACLRSEVFRVEGLDGIVGTSAALSRVLRGVELVAAADSPVLILGRDRDRQGPGRACRSTSAAGAGTGRSCRSTAPRCPTRSSRASCSATRRAPSPAPSRAPSAASRPADGGTIFLDEIGEMPLGRRRSCCACSRAGRSSVSGPRGRSSVDVRVIAATNRDLEKEVREGTLPRRPLLPPERVPRSPAAPARATSRTSRCWSGTSSTPSRARSAGASSASPSGSCAPSSATPGRATSASWRT